MEQSLSAIRLVCDFHLEAGKEDGLETRQGEPMNGSGHYGLKMGKLSKFASWASSVGDK